MSDQNKSSQPLKDTIAENEENGYIHVGSSETFIIYRKKSEVGSWTYYIDEGYDCGALVIWDDATRGRDILSILLGDQRKLHPTDRELDWVFPYLRSEMESQAIRMKALGINIDAQTFEQAVNAVIFMAGEPKGWTDAQIVKAYEDGVSAGASNATREYGDHWQESKGEEYLKTIRKKKA